MSDNNIIHHGPLSIERTTDEEGRSRWFVTDDLTGDWLSEPFDTEEAAAEEINYMHGRPIGSLNPQTEGTS